MSIEQVGVTEFSQLIETLEANLRVIAQCVGVPYDLLSGKAGDRGAYASAVVANSMEHKAILRKQQRWAAYDLELIAHCTGIDPDDIEQHLPSVASPDKKAELEQITMGVEKKIMSRKTAQLRWGLDPETEARQIAEEQASGLYDEPGAMLGPGSPQGPGQPPG